MSLAALCSPAGKGLTAKGSLVCDVFMCFVTPSSGVVFDCIDSWSLPSFLLRQHLPEKLALLLGRQNKCQADIIETSN